MNIKNKLSPNISISESTNQKSSDDLTNPFENEKEIDISTLPKKEILSTYWFKDISSWTSWFATFTKKAAHWIINSKWEIIIDWLSSYPQVQDMWWMLVAFFYLWRPFERWIWWVSAALFFNNFNAGYCKFSADWWINWNKWWVDKNWEWLTSEKFSSVDDFNNDIRWYARFEKIDWTIGYIDTKWTLYKTEIKDWKRYVSIHWKLFKVKN